MLYQIKALALYRTHIYIYIVRCQAHKTGVIGTKKKNKKNTPIVLRKSNIIEK